MSSATTPSRVALVAAPDKATLREARRRVRLRTEPLPPVFDPLLSEQQFSAVEIGRGDVDAAMAAAGARHRGRVPRRPPGAALHREPGHDRGAATRRRHHHHGLDAVPLLRPRGAQARPRPERQPGRHHPGRDRRRLRRQGGVPLDRRHPRGAAGAARGQARAHDLRPPRGPRRDDEAAPGDRALPHGHRRRREAPGTGRRGGHGRRRLLHADAGRALARRPPRRRPVRVPGHAHPRAAPWPRTRRPTARSGASGRRRSSSPRSSRSRARRRSWASHRRSCASAGCTARAA